MSEKPIIMSAPMVRAILAGRKTQTRRAIKRPLKHPGWTTYCYFGPSKNDPTATSMAIECGPDYPDDKSDQVRCPYGAPGSRLWVRETFCDDWRESRGIVYRADGGLDSEMFDAGCKWRPSIYMPRRASRITLEVTDVRVERLHDISEADAIAEGAEPSLVPPDGGSAPHREGYRELWEQINGRGSWAANPWVWVVEFDRLPASITAQGAAK